jgi:Na+/phosphate symporter
LIFNVVTGAAAFLGLPLLVWILSFMVDIRSDSLMGLALFHTLFNILGVVLFFPFLGPLSRLLTKVIRTTKPSSPSISIRHHRRLRMPPRPPEKGDRPFAAGVPALQPEVAENR